LRLFNELHPIGDDVRYFVSNTEVSEIELRAGQPYSVYPRRFERSNETTAKTGDKTNPVRMEGPLIHIQWLLSAETGEQAMMPTSTTVPEEISVSQLWHKSVANRYKKPVETITWGRHFRAGAVVETGMVSELLENDGVEIIITEKKKDKQDGKIEVV
jgi:hypothetical protein